MSDWLLPNTIENSDKKTFFGAFNDHGKQSRKKSLPENGHKAKRVGYTLGISSQQTIQVQQQNKSFKGHQIQVCNFQGRIYAHKQPSSASFDRGKYQNTLRLTNRLHCQINGNGFVLRKWELN